ncbi:MAG: TIGR01212 family radical SAM protein [Marinilabiliales bacterium]|nr:MAG: TIGR01212 family radical SAM protein [Marinilabiliales bacterium]
MIKGEQTYAWGSRRRFNSLADYFKREFGGRVQKVSVNAGFTCPNRDGTVGTGGCTFCDSTTFVPAYCLPGKCVREQIETGIRFHARRYRRAESFLAYFQSYTNTYSDTATLERIWNEALSVPGIRGIVVGTRPDCVDDDVLYLMADMASRCYFVAEFGIESCNDQTLKDVNRGHDFATAVRAIKKTSALGIKTGGHMIFGLPGETREEMLASAPVLSELPLHSLKFHQLQIVKNTPIAELYSRDPGRFRLFELDEYLDFIAGFVERLNPAIIVERFAGELPLRSIAGGIRWGVRNDRIAAMFEKKLEERDSWQGKYYRGAGSDA